MYRIFNIVLDSEILLPELPVTCESNSVIQIQVGGQSGFKGQAPNWFHEWSDSHGNISISVGRVEDDYLLRFPNVAEFLIDIDSNVIQCFFDPDTSPDTIQHLLVDQVVPRILGQQGQLVVHAGCVMMPNGEAIAFLGDSGWGKSTLAASFYESGLQLLTDDCLLIDMQANKAVGIPNYAGVRLFNDSADQVIGQSSPLFPVAHYTDKKRLIMHGDQNNNSERASLEAIFLLVDPMECDQQTVVNIEAVTGVGEMMEIIKRMFVLDVTDKQLQASLFKKVAELLASGVPIYRLSYPRDYSLLSRVRDSVIKALS